MFTLGSIIFLCIVIPMAAFFTALGIFSWKRKKPMWFWAGSTVREEEITDVRAYNRANGLMWIAFSTVFWTSAVLSAFYLDVAGAVLGAGTMIGIVVLIFAYKAIYKKYKK